MNGRCHNDPMDFAAEVCESCGDQFCSNCLVYPRGTSKPPLCTTCAMALSGVRNRRPVKSLSRGEIKKRRKQLRVEIADQDGQEPLSPLQMLGSDLIEGPDIEHQPEPDLSDSRGLMGRFRRRKTDRAAEEEGTSELPAPDVTIVGGESRPEAFDDPETFDPLQPPPPMTPEAEESDPTNQEHSSAAAILEQLREQEGAEDDDVWMPPAAAESTTWTLPEITQSPLGGAGPWESVAHTADPDTNETPADEADEFEPPVFVSEAELRSQGPADTDQTGNWVPPTLRGMAPQAGHNAAELPRRRRQNSPES